MTFYGYQPRGTDGWAFFCGIAGPGMVGLPFGIGGDAWTCLPSLSLFWGRDGLPSIPGHLGQPFV